MHTATIEEIIQKPCAFIIQIAEPAETLKRIATLFQDRHLPIETMQMHRYRDGGAMVIIHTRIEKDRIHRTTHLLEQLQGVLKLERMEGK